MEYAYLIIINHLFYTISAAFITPASRRRKKFTYRNKSILRQFTAIIIVAGIVKMTYIPSRENTDSPGPASFQNTYPHGRHTNEEIMPKAI